MDHDDYYHRASQRMVTGNSTAHSAAPSSAVSSSSANNPSWDAHYKRKGRTRERFDHYPSEEFSPEMPPEYTTDHRRPSEADHSRPVHKHEVSGPASVSTNSSSKNRATCLPNMFYPGDGGATTQEGIMIPPSTVLSSPMGQHNDDEGVRYYPSERFNLPMAAAPASDTGAAFLTDGNDAMMAYVSSRQRAMGHMVAANDGRSTTPMNARGNAYRHASYRERPETSPGALYGIPNAYQRTADPRPPRQGSLYYTRELQYNDYAKENFIMYGEGLQDAPSASTGLSQEELLQRKRREETWQKRREKRQQQKHNRVVQLPSNLFPTQSSRQHHQVQQQEQEEEEQYPSRSYQDMGREKRTVEQVTTTGTTLKLASSAMQKPFEDGGLAGISYETSKGVGSGRGISSGPRNDENRNEGTEKIGSSNARGVRGLMVRRQRNDASSSGRRWKIIPSMVSKPKSETSSPGRARRQDPPAASASTRMKYPRDPPSVHSGKVAPASGESKSGAKASLLEGNPISDDFDNFMENPNFMTGKASNHSNSAASRNSHIGAIIEDYPPSRKTSPNRPSYANFTPKSGYSRDLFSPDTKPAIGKKSSPTSVADFPYSNATGVRWSENLFEHQFVSPESARLDPFATDEIRCISRSKPKSILKKGSGRVDGSSRRNDAKVFSPFDDGKECPSDESPSKSPKRSGNDPQRISDPQPPDDNFGRPFSPLEFIDGNGRTVSPILAESPSTEHDVVKTMAEWAGSHRNNSFDRAPLYYEPAISNNHGIAFQGESEEQLSSSYVDFIEAVAAVVIQTKVRQLLARIKVEEARQQQQLYNQESRYENSEAMPYAQQNRSPVIIQKARTATKQKQLPRKDAALDFYTLAAIRIQAIFRGWWVRDCLAVDNYCATMIQKIYRGWLAVDASITKLYSIVRIQSFLRGCLVRKRLGSSSSERQVYNIAATMIQAQWRSFSCEMKFLRTYEDILLIQSVARGWITRRLIWSWLTAHHQKTFRRSQKLNETPSRNHRRSSRQQLTFQSTPPRKPVEAKNGLSPSYLPHIEYMRKTLTPESEQEDIISAPHAPKVMNAAVREQEIPQKEQSEKKNARGFFFDQRSSRNSQMSSNRDASSAIKHAQSNQPQLAIQTSQNVVAQKRDKNPNESNRERSEIEQRRKEKEREAMAREAEQKRRQEVQAAELAELEFRRKRMALKAEARKKEEASITPVQVMNKASSDRSNYHEEKKESDSFINNSIATNPSDEPDSTPIASTSNKSHPVTPPPPPSNTTTIGPWQLKKRTHHPTSAPKQDVKHSKSSEERVPDKNSLQNQGLVGNRPPFSRNGGIIAARKQQLFMSNGNTNNAVLEEAGVTSVDIDEMNSIVGKVPAEELDHSPMPSTTTMDEFAADDEKAVEEKAATSKKGNHYDVFGKSKDVDVSALTEPTSASPLSPTDVSATAPPKRVSGTNASYVEQMLSQRSKAEQKRLDEIHAIFKRAGLMLRTKRTSC
ncbi:IQ calmodulin-binding motif-containing protein [Nitzschia inconspicua]|uniref:IQ calmodulin-binding motif-containing protein n=1 Tax=Nitzschia inconspicua TaxID=303405 RepID=A0A9K3PZB5_9STRA|nr:IQ calmodulin-binding motif-containing protein [Nitzschia inconspicua]